MPTPPTAADIVGYLVSCGTTDQTEESVAATLAAEIANQRKVVRFPADPAAPAEPLPYPADLAEALGRRVLRALTLRGLPLGLQTSMSEATVATTRVGIDLEIRRLEGPHRRIGALG